MTAGESLSESSCIEMFADSSSSSSESSSSESVASGAEMLKEGGGGGGIGVRNAGDETFEPELDERVILGGDCIAIEGIEVSSILKVGRGEIVVVVVLLI